MTGHGAVNWFEIGTADAGATKAFYGELFGWTFSADPDADGPGYELAALDGAPHGGVFATKGEIPSYAVPYVQVDDVAATVREAERRGGKVLVPQQTTPNGLRFAHILDPHGSRVGVYSPPAV